MTIVVIDSIDCCLFSLGQSSSLSVPLPERQPWHPGDVVQPEPPGHLLGRGQVKLLQLDGHSAKEAVLLRNKNMNSVCT